MESIVSNDPNYSAVITPKQMRCYFNGKSVAVLTVSSRHAASKILNIWSQLNISPQDAQRVYNVSRDFIGLDLKQITLEKNTGVIYYRSKVIGTIF